MGAREDMSRDRNDFVVHVTRRQRRHGAYGAPRRAGKPKRRHKAFQTSRRLPSATDRGFTYGVQSERRTNTTREGGATTRVAMRCDFNSD